MSSDHLKFMTSGTYIYLHFLALAMVGFAIWHMTGENSQPEGNYFFFIGIALTGTISAFSQSMTYITQLRLQVGTLEARIAELESKTE